MERIPTPNGGVIWSYTNTHTMSRVNRGVQSMAGETVGNREGPSPPGPINSISWVGPRGTKDITK